MVKSNYEIDKLAEAKDNYKVKCKCGHSVIVCNRYHREICTWCGNYVYLDKKEEFKNKMKGLLKK